MKALVIATGGVGETVLALPLIRALRERRAVEHLCWVAQQRVAPLLQRVGGIDELAVFDRARLSATGRWRRGWRWARWLWPFVGRRFDLVVTLRETGLARALAAVVRATERLRFGEDGGGVRHPVPGRYLADEWLRLVTGHDGPAMPRAEIPSLWLDPPRPLAQRLEGEGPLVCLAPGLGDEGGPQAALRRWPIAAWRELARALREHEVRVALLGPVEDEAAAHAFEDLEVIDLRAVTDLLETLAVFGRADCVVAVDGALLQLAVLAGVPLVALFGPSPPSRVLRRDVHTLPLWGGADLPCRPCFDGLHHAPCPGNRCLQELEPRHVLDAVLRQIGIERRARTG
ncbi:MAG: hypothetical protein D6776_01355 [Planctomycetota bacterium]|nr:MAG: hypothetical protein D6776_01355 [Planctomycetota bacterium]